MVTTLQNLSWAWGEFEACDTGKGLCDDKDHIPFGKERDNLRAPGSGWGNGAHNCPLLSASSVEGSPRGVRGEDGVPCRFGPGMEVTHSKPSLPHFFFFFFF